VRVWKDGKHHHLGIFATPEEADLRYARHIGAARAAAEAVGIQGPRPATASEVRATAAAEGLELVSSTSNVTGFRGVAMNGSKYEARVREEGRQRYLGVFTTPEEAALRYARHVGAVRAAAEAAEARRKRPQPLTAAEARAAAAAEGLELVSSGNALGFKGVDKNGGKYAVRICEDGKMRHLGTFATPEEAALAFARHTAKLADRMPVRLPGRLPARRVQRRARAAPSRYVESEEEESEFKPSESDGAEEDAEEEEEADSEVDSEYDDEDSGEPVHQHEQQAASSASTALPPPRPAAHAQHASRKRTAAVACEPQLAPRQTAGVETVMIGDFAFRCCASSRKWKWHPSSISSGGQKVKVVLAGAMSIAGTQCSI